MTRNTVPFLSVVPTFRNASSPSPVLFTGKDSVVQTTQLEAPGRFDMTFLQTSSILTTARPLASCPVTTRRTLTAIFSASFLVERLIYQLPSHYHPILPRPRIVLDDGNAVPVRFAGQFHSPCPVKRDGFCVIGSRDRFKFRASLGLCEGGEMIVEAPGQAFAPVSSSDSDQMHIGDRLRLRQEAEEVGRHTVSVLDDIGRVAELVNVHGMVQAQGAVAAPEIRDLGGDLIVVGLGAAPD